MQSQQFGRLVKVDLRKAWNHEALDFTRWLSLDENLQLLRTYLSEAEVGKFNVDILAEEDSTGRKIIIENQI
jgi:hypothetical protein